ncbi:hypothetical protein Bca4012_025033 [Brassica carinata]
MVTRRRLYRIGLPKTKSEESLCHDKSRALQTTLSRIKSRDLAWYFFSDRGSRFCNTNKRSRTTTSGYWKITGKTAQAKERSSGSQRQIGFKKTLVFLTGKSPLGERTNWIMHEYPDLSSPEEMVRSTLFFSFDV